MSDNVISILSHGLISRTWPCPPPGGAIILSLATKKDRRMVNLKKAERIFLAAETLAETEGMRNQAIAMMMELSCDEEAGVLRGRAATWLLDQCRVLVSDEEGRPVSPRLRKRMSAAAGHASTMRSAS